MSSTVVSCWTVGVMFSSISLVWLNKLDAVCLGGCWQQGRSTGCRHDGDALSPRYMRARGLRAERVREVEHFWIRSMGKEVA